MIKFKDNNNKWIDALKNFLKIGSTIDSGEFDADSSESNEMLQYRGLKANLPVLKEGQIGFCTDTKETWIGSTDGNQKIIPISEDFSQLDLNDLTGDFRIAYCDNNAENMPTTNSGQIVYYPHARAGESYGQQAFYEVNNVLYIRKNSNNNWSSWEKCTRSNCAIITGNQETVNLISENVEHTISLANIIADSNDIIFLEDNKIVLQKYLGFAGISGSISSIYNYGESTYARFRIYKNDTVLNSTTFQLPANEYTSISIPHIFTGATKDNTYYFTISVKKATEVAILPITATLFES